MTFPSDEYIKYILSDEAKVLQEGWEPAVGDWVVSGQVLFHVTLHGQSGDELLYVLQSVEDGLRFGVFDSLSEIASFVAEHTPVCFVPRLDQLLQLAVEALGDVVELSVSETFSECYEVVVLGETGRWGNGSDPELAAARLLVAVLGGER